MWNLWQFFLATISHLEDSVSNGPIFKVTAHLTAWFSFELTTLTVTQQSQTSCICSAQMKQLPVVYTNTESCNMLCATYILDQNKQTFTLYTHNMQFYVQNIARTFDSEIRGNAFCQQFNNESLRRFNFKWAHHKCVYSPYPTTWLSLNCVIFFAIIRRIYQHVK